MVWFYTSICNFNIVIVFPLPFWEGLGLHHELVFVEFVDSVFVCRDSAILEPARMAFTAPNVDVRQISNKFGSALT